MLAGSFDNLLINGGFLGELWGRVRNPTAGVECPIWRQTCAADRWKLRYENAEGAAVTQAFSLEVPDICGIGGSLEIRGAREVTQSVYIGQRVEAAESIRYRRGLVFSAWVYIGSDVAGEAEIELQIGSALRADVFGDCSDGDVKIEIVEKLRIERANEWMRVECEVDGRGLGSNGLSVELKIPAKYLNGPESRVMVTGVRLTNAIDARRDADRPVAVEGLLAKRYFQRHSAATVNSMGRALVANRHELHFQFAFPEMRAYPACTLPQDNEQLRVFDLEGIPQSDFAYDVTYRSRGSVIIRATKRDHGVRDGYLSFVGNEVEILLDAEL